jgi:hypothetical protein
MAAPYTDLEGDEVKGGMVSYDQPSPSRLIQPTLLRENGLSENTISTL